MHKNYPDNSCDLGTDPDPPLNLCAAGYQDPEGKQHTKGHDTEHGVGDAQQTCLLGLHHRTATEDRVNVARRLVVAVLQDVYFVVSKRERGNNSHYPGKDKDIG